MCVFSWLDGEHPESGFCFVWLSTCSHISTIRPHPSYTFPKHRAKAPEVRSSFCSPLKSFHSHFSETKQIKDLLAYVERFKKILSHMRFEQM